ncbi:MAG: hypothetical protein AAF468_10375 [Pseudomonadota bacterium]
MGELTLRAHFVNIHNRAAVNWRRPFLTGIVANLNFFVCSASDRYCKRHDERTCWTPKSPIRKWLLSKLQISRKFSMYSEEFIKMKFLSVCFFSVFLLVGFNTTPSTAKEIKDCVCVSPENCPCLEKIMSVIGKSRANAFAGKNHLCVNQSEDFVCKSFESLGIGGLGKKPGDVWICKELTDGKMNCVKQKF